jgi:carbon storage regulator CsrA
MLILSRRPGDAILIEGGIRIVVLACDRRGVRIGIEAPAAVGIVREEIAHVGKNQGPAAIGELTRPESAA